MKGFLVGHDSRQDGNSRRQHWLLLLEDVRVPQENMVGEEGEGFKIAMFALEQGRYTVASARRE
jgi:alkylation response protein AidB-like acyl-CoA dehydrogenase